MDRAPLDPGAPPDGATPAFGRTGGDSASEAGGADAPVTARERRAVAAIVLVAITVRVAHVLWMRASPYFEHPVLDGEYHVQWARALAAGREFQPGPYFRAPLYPWFLGLLRVVFGDGLLAPRLVQALLGGATAGLTWRVGRSALGARQGLVAAAAMAVAWVPVHFDGELLIPTLFVPLVLLALWRSLELRPDASLRSLLAVGALWGLAALARPNALLLVPVVAGVQAWRARRRAGPEGAAASDARAGVGGRPAPGPLAALFAVGAGALLALAPVTAVNRLRGGEWVLVSTQAGVNFWIGNNPASDGMTAIVPGTRGGWWEGFHDARALAEAEAGRALDASGVSRHYGRKAGAWMRTHPGDFVRHTLHKTRLIVGDRELGNNLSVGFFARRYDPLARLRLVPWSAVLGLGAVGWVLALRRPRGRRAPTVLLAFPWVYGAGVVAFFVCSRFRLPLWPVGCVFAAHALVVGLDAWRRGRRTPVLVGAGLALGLALASRLEPPGLMHPEAVGEMELGLAAAAAGDHPAAAGHLRRSVEHTPHPWGAEVGLANSLWALGQAEEALAVLRTAGERGFQPDVEELRVGILLAERRPAEARTVAEAALARNPALATLRFRLGKACLQLGDAPAARAALEACRDAPGLRFDAGFVLGVLHDQEGRAGEAREAYARALDHRDESDEPAFVEQAYDRLLLLLRGDGLEERARAREAERAAWRARPASDGG